MKNLANELDIAVIVVSQFNRTAKDERPQLWHLKESSAIEHDATLVLMLHTEDDKGESLKTEVIVRKQRHGGKATLLSRRGSISRTAGSCLRRLAG